MKKKKNKNIEKNTSTIAKDKDSNNMNNDINFNSNTSISKNKGTKNNIEKKGKKEERRGRKASTSSAAGALLVGEAQTKDQDTQHQGETRDVQEPASSSSTKKDSATNSNVVPMKTDDGPRKSLASEADKDNKDDEEPELEDISPATKKHK